MRDRLVDIHSHCDFAADVVGIRNVRFPEVAPAGMYSVGVHPWDADRCLLTSDFYDLAENAVAIGECGLDKCCGVPIDIQQTVFEKQIELSLRLNKPMIIHCVRAYGRMMDISQSYSPHPAWLIHGCYASAEWIRQAVASGMFFSLGPSQIRQKRFGEIMEAIPNDRLLLETDDSGWNIADVYNAVNISSQDIWSNFQRYIAGHTES